MQRILAVAALGVVVITGCSFEPDRLEILVATTPPGAACLLTRAGQPLATVDPTPAIAWVDPVGGEIAVHCRRPGFADAVGAVPGVRTHASFGYQTRVDITLQPPGPQALLPPR